MTASRGKRRFLFLLCLSGFFLFAALGVWQVQRLAWKRDLIARVDARANASPSAVPDRMSNPSDYEYRRVRVNGAFRHDSEILVDALTDRGAGFWVMTPLETAGGTIFVNRGFVPPERRSPTLRPAAQIAGLVSVTGLLRLSEPGGRVLRPNRPAERKFYSRDVAAMAAVARFRDVKPFFIDADARPNPGGYPIGGLTVVKFRNVHLVYALTWFALSGLCLLFLSKMRVSASTD